DLRLVLERAAVVEGRIVDAEGNGVQAQVRATWGEDLSDSDIFASTDKHGHFRIEVPPGFHGAIHANGTPLAEKGYLSARCPGVVAGQTDLVLRLQRAVFHR